VRRRDRKKDRIADLGFESVSSLTEALRIDASQLEYVLDSCQSGYPYECWYEPKRSGKGNRLIEHPCPALKRVQQSVNSLLQRLDLPSIFHGSHVGTSVVSNALPHRSSSWFLTFDLANYYKNIRPQKVYRGFVEMGAAPDVARVLTRLTTIKGRVPQGAPTSPVVAAIAMLNLARRLANLGRPFHAKISVYGDNVAISGPKAILGQKRTILRIATSEGFRVRADKTEVRSPGEDKPLPGVLVRAGKITIYDEDFDRASRLLDACLGLGACGLSRRVCNRFCYKLRGIVNHFAWIDPERMRGNRRKFEKIRWPEDYDRTACWSPKCHCTPVQSGLPLLLK